LPPCKPSLGVATVPLLLKRIVADRAAGKRESTQIGAGDVVIDEVFRLIKGDRPALAAIL